MNRIDESKEELYNNEIPIMWDWQKYSMLNLTFDNIIFICVFISLYNDNEMSIVTKIIIANSVIHLSTNISRIIQLLENVTTQYSKLEVYLDKLNKVKFLSTLHLKLHCFLKNFQTFINYLKTLRPSFWADMILK